jgi:hypothetical protein
VHPQNTPLPAGAGPSQRQLKLRNAQTTRETPAQDPVLMLPWSSLVEGETVDVLKDGVSATSGVVDAVMPDGSAVWLWLANGQGRIMVHHTDPVTLQSPYDRGITT